MRERDSAKLKWHLWQRGDGKPAEYATDHDGNPLFLIMNDNTLYEAEHHEIDCEGIKVERVVWNEVWAFDLITQARREARIRYADRVRFRTRAAE